jgi:aspartate racemase
MAPIVGVVGGMGPEGTVFYYRKLTAAFAALPPEARPGIVVDHVWLDRFAALLRAGTEDEIGALFAGSLGRLERAGAAVALIAAVTPHRFLPMLRRLSPLPIVDLVAAARDDVRAAGHRTVGLLGTRYTLTEPFFRGGLEEAGVTVVVPDGDGIERLDALIYGPLAAGEKTPAMRAEIAGIVVRMAARARLDALVVGCTDLMDVLETTLPLVDPIDGHVRAAVRALQGR